MQSEKIQLFLRHNGEQTELANEWTANSGLFTNNNNTIFLTPFAHVYGGSRKCIQMIIVDDLFI